MFRIKLLLAALVVAASSLVALPAPSQAVLDWNTNAECINFDNDPFVPTKTVCLTVWWKKQADGDGVALELQIMQTTSGCSQFPPTAWKKVYSKLFYNSTIYKSWSFGDEANCTWSKDFDSIRGRDGAWSDFRTTGCVGNNYIEYTVRLRADGTWNWLQSQHTDGAGTPCS